MIRGLVQSLAAIQSSDLSYTNQSFILWWTAASSGVEGQVQKRLNSIIILAAWSIWKHRNAYVFDGVRPNVSYVVSAIIEELYQWPFVGA